MLTREFLRKMELQTVDDISHVAACISDDAGGRKLEEQQELLAVLVKKLLLLRQFISQLPRSVN